jgi:hypothetical protein
MAQKKIGHTDPAAPKKTPPKRTANRSKATKGLEIGDTGTRILSGIIREEYNPKLRDRAGLDVFDEMRKSDGTCRAAVLACSLPIRSADWYVEPASEDAADNDISDFVAAALFEYPSLGWDDVLRQALMCLPFGVMVFEKVFTTRNCNGKTCIVWDKFAPRMPRSIYRWAIGGDNADGITQFRSDGSMAEIPMEKLVVIVNEMEGMNWWGTSILRPAYKHWFLKNNLYKIDAIAHERQGLGIPYVKLPEGYTEGDRGKAETILKNLRANSHAFIIEPYDYDFGFKDMMSHTTRDPSQSIAHHDRQILISVLAQFLQLGASNRGATASGSRALSQDHSKLFLNSLEAVATQITDAFNAAIKELVDLNYDGVQNYPKLAFTGLSETDGLQLSTAYATLITSGGLQAGKNDEQFFREVLGLPERDPDEPPIVPPAQEQNVTDPTTEPDPKKKAYRERRASEATGTFKPWRKLTFAEQKVNFDGLQKQMDQLEADFDAKTRELLHGARDTYMAAFTKAAHAGDAKGIKDATLKVQADLARIIKQAMTAAFLYGKNNAAKEINVAAPPNPIEMLRQIDIQADAIAAHQIARIEADSKIAYVNALNTGSSLTTALGEADAAAGETIDTVTGDASSVLMSAYINQGRNTVFANNAKDIYALQRSEILDSRTCGFCLSMDERIVSMDDDLAATDIFHSNCRGIWVAILNDEAEKPDITGVPQSLRSRFGNSVNDLVQPPKPITKANTPARAEADRRAQN